MATARRMRFVTGHLAWTLGVIVVLAALGSLALDLVFVLSYLGFLALIEVTAPVDVSVAWRRRLRWFVGLGLVAFAYLVVRRVLSLLPGGVV
ncbi:hypothetical protein [Halomarina pelagica]|uniref:hypothetical protein n=1 Tax=Halomarina pelagica TaxID=2961599 RepID=UPI0020C351AC|nr:hypothetical protein [Halomarina sp. BND7]